MRKLEKNQFQIIYKMKKDIMLFPSCSESCFRLTGNLGSIKAEVIKMLDIWQKEQEEGWNKRENEINSLKQRINNIKTLEEFEDIVFEFTCNYETYFKKEDKDLLVATCNNHDWDDVNYIPENSEDYCKIAGKIYCINIFEDEKHIVFKEKDWTDKSNTLKLFFVYRPNFEITYDKYDKRAVEIFKKSKGISLVQNNQLIKLEEITDKNILTKLKVLIALK